MALIKTKEQYQPEIILESFDGEIEIIKEIYREFEENRYCWELFAGVDRALCRGDFPEVSGLAHKLKGCFAHFKIEPLSNAAKELETYGALGDGERARKSLNSLKKEYMKLISVLSDLCNN